MTFGEKTSASTGRGNEIPGLLKKIMMKNMMTPKIVKSRMRRFSCAKVEAGTGKLGLSVGRDHSKSSSW